MTGACETVDNDWQLSVTSLLLRPLSDRTLFIQLNNAFEIYYATQHSLNYLVCTCERNSSKDPTIKVIHCTRQLSNTGPITADTFTDKYRRTTHQSWIQIYRWMFGVYSIQTDDQECPLQCIQLLFLTNMCHTSQIYDRVTIFGVIFLPKLRVINSLFTQNLVQIYYSNIQIPYPRSTVECRTNSQYFYVSI